MARLRPENLNRDTDTASTPKCMDSSVPDDPVNPPPLPAEPPVVSPVTKGKAFRRIALLSWLLPVAGGITIVVGDLAAARTGQISGIGAVVAVLLFGAAIIGGIVALCGMRRYGKRGILWPALVGLIVGIPLLIVGLLHGLFTVLHNAALPPRAHLSPAAHSPSARRLTDDQLHFSIDIPQGFQDYPEAKAASEVAYGFIRRSADRQTACVITIERLDTVLTRAQRLRASQLPPDARGEITPRKWRGLDIDVVVAPVVQGGVTTYTYQCLVPLRPKAIRVMVAETGPESDPDALSRLVDILLASLDGETNW